VVTENCRAKRIFLAEHIPSLNKGELSILTGLVHTLRAHLGPHKLAVLSWMEDVDRVRYSPDIEIVGAGTDMFAQSDDRVTWALNAVFLGLRLLGASVIWRLVGDRARPLLRDRLWRTFTEADVILVGHDNAATVRGGISPLLAATVVAAKVTGKRIAIVAGSIGPFRGSAALAAARLVLKRVDLLTLRDPLSASYCRAARLTDAPTYLTADLAFLVEPVSSQESERILAREGIPKDRPIVGITVVEGSAVFRHAFASLGVERGIRGRKHAEAMAEVADYLVEQLGASVAFIPHSIGPGLRDDRIVARKVYERVLHRDRVWVVENEYSDAELKGLLSLFDFFIGERTHSLIAALSGRVPSVGISFPDDHRTYGIIGEMLGLGDWLYDVRALDPVSLCSHLRNCWERKGDMRRKLDEVIPRIEQRSQLNGALIAGLLERHP
jgi:colanic acid/amylovoran biosynthesis protein